MHCKNNGNELREKAKPIVSKRLPELVLRVVIISCIASYVCTRIFLLESIYGKSWNEIPLNYYLSLVPSMVIPVFLLVFTVAPNKLVCQWTVGVLSGLVIMNELTGIVIYVSRGLEVMRHHIEDLADETYRAYGYGETYRQLLISVIIFLGIAIGYIMILLKRKNSIGLWRKILCAFFCIISVYSICDCFTSDMRWYRMVSRDEYYSRLSINIFDVLVCLAGVWLTIKQSLPEKTIMQNSYKEQGE